MGKLKNSPDYKVDIGNGKKLGEGMFGTVRLVMALQKCRKSAERAVKTLNLNQAKRIGVRRQSLNQELLIHSEASEAQRDLAELSPAVLTPPSHPLIVKLHEIFVDNMEISVVMERLGNNIAEFMENGRAVVVLKARRWAGELASALHFLHNMQMVAHRDVKSDNVLLDGDESPEHIRLSDFGFATACKDSSSLCNKTFCGTPEFIAPELLHKSGKTMGYNGQKADMWSMGVVTLEMYGVYNPFGDPSGDRDIMTIVRNVSNPEFMPTMPTAAGVEDIDKEFILSLLKRSASERLNAAEAVIHPLFQHTTFSGASASSSSNGARGSISPKTRVSFAQVTVAVGREAVVADGFATTPAGRRPSAAGGEPIGSGLDRPPNCGKLGSPEVPETSKKPLATAAASSSAKTDEPLMVRKESVCYTDELVMARTESGLGSPSRRTRKQSYTWD